MDSEASLEYDDDEVVTLRSESDDSDSGFEASELDSEDKEERDISLRDSRNLKLPYKRTSRVAIRHFDDLEEEEATMFDAALKASIRNMVNRGSLTTAGSTGCSVSRRTATAATAADHRFVMEQGFEVASEVEGEVLVLTNSEDEPIIQRGQTHLARRRNRDQGKTEYNAEHHDYFSASCLEKREIRTLEYQLVRSLTPVDSSGNFYVPRFVCSQWPCHFCSSHYAVDL